MAAAASDNTVVVLGYFDNFVVGVLLADNCAVVALADNSVAAPVDNSAVVVLVGTVAEPEGLAYVADKPHSCSVAPVKTD